MVSIPLRCRRLARPAVVLALCLCRPGLADPTAVSQTEGDTVLEIHIVGNNRTQERVVRTFLDIDTGEVVDSAALAQAEARLMGAGVFSKAKILRVPKPHGIHLYVVLTEGPRLNLSDIGGVLYSSRYGSDDSFWRLWRINTAFSLRNVGGRLESLTMSLSFWEWRSVFVTWRKPLLSTPYALSVGGGMSSYPYTSRPWQSLSLRGKLSGSRVLAPGARVYIGASPRYNRMVYHGPSDPGTYRVWARYDTSSTASASLHTAQDRTSDTSWTDLVRLSPTSVEVRQWSGNRLWDESQADRRYFEVYTGLGAVVSRVDRESPHQRGWYGWWQVGGNIPSADDNSARAYVQFDTDMRLYQPAWPRRTSLAYRVQASLRGSDGGKFHTVTAGGETTVRGFGSGWLGLRTAANNRVLATAEYRFPMFKTPSMHLPGIVDLVLPTREIHYRFDGAFYIDYAHLWHDLTHPLTAEERGLGIGTGFRMLLVPSGRAICFDLLPFVFYQGEMISRFTDMAQWAYHWYIDFAF